jgi:tetratricopeptide (TPR) repeat protein
MNKQQSSPRYLIQEAALFLLFCYLVFFANTWRFLASYDHIRFGVAALALTTALWLAYRRWPGQSPQPMPLGGPLALFLLVYLLTAFTSTDLRRSLDEVWVAGLYVFLFALTAELVNAGWPRELFIKTLLLAGALVAGLAWWAALGWYRTWLSVAPGQWLPEIAYRLPLANGLATFFNLLLIMAVARFMATRARLPRLLLVGWGVLVLGLIFLTVSRGGWLGLLSGIGLLALMKVREAGGATYARQLWDILRTRWMISVTILILGIAGLAVIGWVALRQLDSPVKASAFEARTEFWVPAWRAFSRSPLVGNGPLTFGSIYLLGNSVPPSAFYPHAHSIFFNLLAETGILGVAAFGVLAATAFRALWNQVNELQGEDRAVAVGGLAAAVAFAAHSLVDSVNVEPINSATIAVILGVALAPAVSSSSAQSNRAKVFVRMPIVLGLALSATGLYNVWRLTPLHVGVEAARRGEWVEAADHFEEAVRRDSRNAIAYQQLGLAKSILADAGQPEALEQAIAAFEKTVQLDPAWWLNHANLGSLYAAQNDHAAALAEMQTAVELAPRSALAHLNLGVAAEGAGERALAESVYQATLNLRPDWADAYFWRATPFRSQVLAAWRQTAPPTPTPTLAELETATQGGDRAGQYIRLASAYLELGRLDEIEVLLKKAGLAFFESEEVRLEMLWVEAEWAAARGDWRTAAIKGEQAVYGYQLQSAFGPGAFGQATYGPIVFRQETMAVDLAPQLTRAPLTDRWAQRMLQVGGWYEAVGDETKAQQVYADLLRLAPGNVEAQDRLQK